MPLPATFDERLARVRDLGVAWASPAFAAPWVAAYVDDTAFCARDAWQREVSTPAALLALPELAERVADGVRSGIVHVVVPRNSVGLTVCKAVVGAYLAGHPVHVRLPSGLPRSAPLLVALLVRHLPGVTFAPTTARGAAFLDDALQPGTAAVVVYGDDAWIAPYAARAEAVGVALFFEGPGSDPFIVRPGANVALAVDAAIRGGLHNGGQSCSAFERFFVPDDLHDAFVDALVARLRTLPAGDPRDPTTVLGPMSSRAAFDRIGQQIAQAVDLGARLVDGGRPWTDPYSGRPGWVPSVLTGVRPELSVMADETFGPVFPVMAYTADDALWTAVDACRYGLNAAAFGPDASGLAARLAARHRNVYVNATPFDADQVATRIVDGGYGASALHGAPGPDGYRWRSGPRRLARALAELTDLESR